MNPFAPNSKCSCNGVPINLEISPLNKDSILFKNCSNLSTKLSSSSKSFTSSLIILKQSSKCFYTINTTKHKTFIKCLFLANLQLHIVFIEK
ncbi:hypothetical protein BLOT_011150 [Blomia tropicalis]|nr:hypothetical protein BLOT_011150 [Blomia tropicalis]